MFEPEAGKHDAFNAIPLLNSELCNICLSKRIIQANADFSFPSTSAVNTMWPDHIQLIAVLVRSRVRKAIAA
jgi:hypothetical protein